MQRRYLIAGAAVALMAGLYGNLKMRAAAAPANLSSQALSGADLASDPNILLVDIRQPEEWAATGVVEGALLVPFAHPDAFMSIVAPHLTEGQKLALICRSGNRTSMASKLVAEMTDHEVIDVAGGMIRVVGEGYQPVPPKRR